MAGRRVTKSKGKTKAKTTKRGGKKKAATKKGAKSKGATKRISKKTKAKKTYESSEDKRREMVFKVQKSYKNSDLLNLNELIDDGNSCPTMSGRETSKYLNAAKDLIKDYRNKSFEGSGIVFSRKVFECLQQKADLDS